MPFHVFPFSVQPLRALINRSPGCLISPLRGNHTKKVSIQLSLAEWIPLDFMPPLQWSPLPSF